MNSSGCVSFGLFSYVALLSGCNNEQPKSEQIVAVATATSVPKPTPTAKPTPIPKPKYFSKLRLVKPTYDGSRVKIRGSTDLPTGAKINITFNVADRKETETYIGVDEDVQVKNGRFTSELEIPDRPEFGFGNYKVEVMFTPRGQSNNV